MSLFTNGTNCRLFKMGRIDAWNELSLGTNCRPTRKQHLGCCLVTNFVFARKLRVLSYLHHRPAFLRNACVRIKFIVSQWPNNGEKPNRLFSVFVQKSVRFWVSEKNRGFGYFSVNRSPLSINGYNTHLSEKLTLYTFNTILGFLIVTISDTTEYSASSLYIIGYFL